MGQNFCGFRGLPNICEKFIRELGVLAVLSRDSGQHPRKFYLRIFIFGAIRENFVLRNFPLYGSWAVVQCSHIVVQYVRIVVQYLSTVSFPSSSSYSWAIYTMTSVTLC